MTKERECINEIGKLEEAVERLAQAVRELINNLPPGIEEIARVVLLGYLERHYKIKVEELVRKFFEVDGREIEVNLYGEGNKDGKKIIILGEAKPRIYERDVREFYLILDKVLTLIEEKVFKVMFGYVIHPSASKLAEEHEIILVASYMR